MMTIEPWMNEPSALHEPMEIAAAVATGPSRCRAESERWSEELAAHGSHAVFATLAHELRNPLACVTQAAQLLRTLGVRGEGDPQAWAVACIERHIQRLGWIVDDLLGTGQANRGKITSRSTLLDAATIIESALESIRALMDTRRHRLTVNLPPGPLWLQADACHLEQVLVNLLSNAARYTPAGGRIRLHAERQGAEIILRVTDTGIGLSPEELASLFQPFFRGETARSCARDGLGIGLTVVRRLVELHAGRIEVSSAGAGRGSTFTIRFPAASGTAFHSTSRELTVKIDAFRILIVDDNRDFTSGLSRLLQRHGHRVQCAHTGIAALQLAPTFQPEFVLVDASLPDLSGYEIAALLPGVLDSVPVRVASISGSCAEEDYLLSEAAGCVAHLQKPVDITEIEALLGCAAHQPSLISQ